MQERLTYWDLEEARTEKDLMMLAEERSGVAMQGFGAGRGEGASGFVKADIDLSGHHLAARDMSFLHGRSSDPYVSLLQGGLLVATTEVVPHNLNPVWKTLTVNVRHDLPVKIKCWDQVHVCFYARFFACWQPVLVCSKRDTQVCSLSVCPDLV